MATMSAQDFIIDAQELAEAQDLLDLIDPAELTVQMNDEGQYVAGRSSSSLPEEACSGSDGIPAVESAQHGAASSSFLCWGAILKGDGGTSCEQSGFCPGKNHFKSKFCPACIKSIEIPSSRMRAMRAEMQGLFANSQRSGFWKNAPDSLGGGEVRIANNTITCDGPWLIIYKSLPPEHGLVQWEPMPDGWVEPATGMVRLSVCKGTLVPSCEMWRHTTGRKHAASSEAGESQSLVRHSWQIDSVPKRHRRAHSSSGSGAWPGGSSSAGGGGSSSAGGGGSSSAGGGSSGGSGSAAAAAAAAAAATATVARRSQQWLQRRWRQRRERRRRERRELSVLAAGDATACSAHNCCRRPIDEHAIGRGVAHGQRANVNHHSHHSHHHRCHHRHDQQCKHGTRFNRRLQPCTGRCPFRGGVPPRDGAAPQRVASTAVESRACDNPPRKSDADSRHSRRCAAH